YFFILLSPPRSTLFPFTTLFRSPEIRQRDRGILYVPAWTSSFPRTVPEYLARLLALPQRKIPRMLFPRIRIHPVNRQVLKLLVGKFPVAWKLGDVKVDITLNLVSQTLLEKSCDLIDDLGNMIRSVGIEVYAFHVKILHVFKEGFRKTLSERKRFFP